MGTTVSYNLIANDIHKKISEGHPYEEINSKRNDLAHFENFYRTKNIEKMKTIF